MRHLRFSLTHASLCINARLVHTDVAFFELRVEHGNLLLLLYGDKREKDVVKAYQKAAKLKPHDAMEQLDAEFAKAQIE